MVIAVWVISLLSFLLAPILLTRFRKHWVAAFNLTVTTESRADSQALGSNRLSHFNTDDRFLPRHYSPLYTNVSVCNQFPMCLRRADPRRRQDPGT
jgi:hypothetical protein